jgi:hypothetical protein
MGKLHGRPKRSGQIVALPGSQGKMDKEYDKRRRAGLQGFFGVNRMRQKIRWCREESKRNQSLPGGV